jgi:hypothetical protein
MKPTIDKICAEHFNGFLNETKKKEAEKEN